MADDKREMEISLAVLENAPRETLLQVIEILLGRIARHEKRIEELEAKLKRNSSNSNQPPSSDSPYAKGKPKKAKSKKRR